MNRTAIHMRIVGLNVSNEDVDTRKEAAAELATTWGRMRNRKAVVQKASEIAVALGGDGIPPSDLGTEVESVLQKFASAFLYSERPFDVGICSGVAVIDLMAREPGCTGWAVVDSLAASLWSAVGFQPALEDARREALRTEVLEVAQSRTMRSGELARERTDVDDFGNIRIVEGKLTAAQASFERATAGTIRALRRNAALDREELDFLWWAQSNRSKLLRKPFSELEETTRVIVSGIEAAKLLRRLPCDVHRDVVLTKLDRNVEKNLSEVLEDIGNHRDALNSPYSDPKGIVFLAPSVFPLLRALATGSPSSAGSQIRRPAGEWGARALLEAGLVQLLTTGPKEL